MLQSDVIQPQVLIIGGGASGLWLANELKIAGVSFVVLESEALGAGQTIASQGILHGGTKYALSRFFEPAAYAIREMPGLWRRCLAGEQPGPLPDLSRTCVRANSCHLWRTDSSSSRLAQLGARLFLRAAPRRLRREDWPASLRDCPGAVYRLDEQVIAPASLLSSLAAPLAGSVLAYDADDLEVGQTDGVVEFVNVRSPDGTRSIRIEPMLLILAAGAGNAALNRLCGLSGEIMQSRPLHMVMLRGDLPELNGHCVDGRSTRVTVTTDQDAAGRTVWQVGGQVAERGVDMRELDLIRLAHDELNQVLPGVDLSRAEWATYRATRAEGVTPMGRRPQGPVVVGDTNVVTCWPTKLVLVPELASRVRQTIQFAPQDSGLDVDTLAGWPRPPVAQPPWETAQSWTRIP